MADNLHPVDELYALRRELAAINKRIEELRKLILDLPINERAGSTATALVIERNRTIIDAKTIGAEMGDDWLAARSTTSIVTHVRTVPLRRRTQP